MSRQEKTTGSMHLTIVHGKHLLKKCAEWYNLVQLNEKNLGTCSIHLL
jgi:hypothetical protein